MYGSTLRRRAVAGAFLLSSALAVMAGGPGSAVAGTASVQGDTVVYDAAAGETNHVDLVDKREQDKTTILVQDAAGMNLGPGCSATANVRIAECPVVPGPAKVELNLANGNDSVDPDFLVRPAGFGRLESPMEANGGPGNDTINGGPTGDILSGGDGDDNLFGLDGPDELFGNVGQDELYGGLGDDDGEGNIGPDTLEGFSGDDEMSGGDGDDTVNGGFDDDTLNGDGGNDTVSGGDGEDVMNGDGGADAMKASDGEADSVNCGTNLFRKDTADIDALDTALFCESVS
jgi:Ca2+-binding RTX toxin-like protein